MYLHLIAVGESMPSWVKAGYKDYAERLQQDYRLQLIEIPAEKRGKNADLGRIKEREGEKILAAIPAQAHQVIALEVGGQSWSTETLAERLSQWQLQSTHIALLIGGPEGLSDACRRKASIHWSLSPLTLPHPLVRIVVAEQLYRAVSILKNHPYHR